MSIRTLSIPHTLVITAGFSLAAACGSSSGTSEGDYDAVLTIVGDQQLSLDSRTQTELEVRYHDQDGEPLAGGVLFDIEGDTGGAYLVDSSAETDDDGHAAVVLEAANEDEVSFSIEATAPDAAPAVWDINIAERETLDWNGLYQVESQFDIVSGLEGTIGTALNAILDISDDPGLFLADILVEQCEDAGLGVFCNGVDVFKGDIADLINDYLGFDGDNDHEIEIVNVIRDVADAIREVARNFGVESELMIEAEDEAGEAAHELIAAVIEYDGHSSVVPASDDPVEADGIAFSVGTGQAPVHLAAHSLPFGYGAMLAAAVDEVVIPAVDEDSGDFGGLLANVIDCEALGEEIDDFIQEQIVISVEVGEDACEFAMDELAEILLDELAALDEDGLELEIEGAASIEETNDNRVELIQGSWEGTLGYPGDVAAELDSSENSFSAERE